jgi:hypothetical protein
MENNSAQIKKEAYYQGFFERAREYGISDDVTFNIVKNANESIVPGMHGGVEDYAMPSKLDELKALMQSLPDRAMTAGREGLEALRGLPGKAMESGREGLEALRGLPGQAMEAGRAGLHDVRQALQDGGISQEEFMQLIKDHPYLTAGAAGGGLAAAGGGAALAHYLSNKGGKQKKAYDTSSLQGMYANSLNSDQLPMGSLTSAVSSPAGQPPAAGIREKLQEILSRGNSLVGQGKEKAQELLHQGQEGMDWLKTHGQQGMDWARAHGPELGGAALGLGGAAALASYLRNRNKEQEQY